MTPIRPHLPAPTGPLSGGAGPDTGRAAQAAFFRAALAGVQAPAAAPAAATPSPIRQPAAASSESSDVERFQRPGRLLDIRV